MKAKQRTLFDDVIVDNFSQMSKMSGIEYYCCDLHYSSYCSECQGELCIDRIVYDLNSEGGNQERIKEINKFIKESDTK